jgi:hypothetical protein
MPMSGMAPGGRGGDGWVLLEEGDRGFKQGSLSHMVRWRGVWLAEGTGKPWLG